jgi:katanin p80 WD40 repeat-containing subunit B1
LKTLNGHKSSARALEFHPYGEYVASGSLDTNIKLWDLRRKGCIFTYKGHTDAVNCLRFSPDGRWIASAGEDGLIKLWDLGAGKQLCEFRHHTAPVNCIEFHPNELFLASGSSDRTVKFWDLESLQMVSSTDGDSTPIRSLSFHPDALCLYAGAENHLKVYNWEPVECLDSIATHWGRAADLTITQNQLIGASFQQSNVSIFIVDIERMQPLGGAPVAAVTRPPTTSSRRSFIADRLELQVTPPTRAAEDVEESSATGDETLEVETPSAVDVRDPQQYQEVFHPRHKLSTHMHTSTLRSEA